MEESSEAHCAQIQSCTPADLSAPLSGLLRELGFAYAGSSKEYRSQSGWKLSLYLDPTFADVGLRASTRRPNNTLFFHTLLGDEEVANLSAYLRECGFPVDATLRVNRLKSLID